MPPSLAVRAAGGEIPTLCFDERQVPFGACRVCLVGVRLGATLAALESQAARAGLGVSLLTPEP